MDIMMEEMLQNARKQPVRKQPARKRPTRKQPARKQHACNGETYAMPSGVKITLTSYSNEEKNKKMPHKVTLFQCCVCKLVFQDKSEANKHLLIHVTTADSQQTLLSQPHLLAIAKDTTSHTVGDSQHSSITQDGSKVENSHIYSQFAVVEPATSALQNTGDSHECKVCGKLFSSLLSRNQHLIIHMVEPSAPLPTPVPAPVATPVSAPVPTPVLANPVSPHAPVLQTLTMPVLKLKSQVSPPMSVINTAVSQARFMPQSTSYECTLCGQRFSSVAGRNQHIKTHVGQLLYKCPKCRRLFTDQTLYATHVKTHNKQPVQIATKPQNNTTFVIEPPSALRISKPATTSVSAIRPTVSIIKPVLSTFNSSSASVSKPNTVASYKLTCQVCGLDCKTLSDWMSHMSSHTWESLPEPQMIGQAKDNRSTDSASETETNEHKTWMETEITYNNIAYSTGDLDPNLEIKTEPELHLCVLCGEEFGTWEELDTHLQVHGVQKPESDDKEEFMFNTEDKTQRLTVDDMVITSRKTVDKSRYKCPVCNKGFLRPSDLRKHMMTHTGERPYVCCVCDLAFQHIHPFNVHFAKHVKANSQACMICQQTCENPEDLIDHILSHTKGATVPQCAYCGKDFGKKGIMRQHIAIHIGAQVYKCKRCHIDFPTKAALQEHVLIHTAGKPLYCAICNKRFTWPETLYRHIQHRNCKQFRQSSAVPTIDMDAYEDEVKKEITELLGGKKQALGNHTNEVTTKIPYTCIHCAQEFSLCSAYKIHMKMHETRKGSHTCPHCRRTYRNRHKFRKHVEGHTCKCCGKVFSKMFDLRKHLMTIKETHACFICKKSFNHSSILKRHLKTHTDMNPQMCFKCGWQFRCQDAFAKHKCRPRRYMHCATCVKGFVTVKELESHLKVHIKTKGRNRHKHRHKRVI